MNVFRQAKKRDGWDGREDPLEYSRRVVARQSPSVQREVARQNAILRGEEVETREQSLANLGFLGRWRY